MWGEHEKCMNILVRRRCFSLRKTNYRPSGWLLWIVETTFLGSHHMRTFSFVRKITCLLVASREKTCTWSWRTPCSAWWTPWTALCSTRSPSSASACGAWAATTAGECLGVAQPLSPVWAQYQSAVLLLVTALHWLCNSTGDCLQKCKKWKPISVSPPHKLSVLLPFLVSAPRWSFLSTLDPASKFCIVLLLLVFIRLSSQFTQVLWIPSFPPTSLQSALIPHFIQSSFYHFRHPPTGIFFLEGLCAGRGVQPSITSFRSSRPNQELLGFEVG